MANTEVEVYNLALSALGTFSSLAATTDPRREAEVCNLWFPLVRDHILRCAPWPSAKGYRRLASVAARNDSLEWANTDPPPGWLYAHAVPNDFLWPRSFSTYQQFEMSAINGTSIIASNVETPILIYTRRQTNVSLWDPDLTMAVAYDLASRIARSLNGSEGDQLKMFSLAQSVITEAKVTAANLFQQSLESTPLELSARGYSLSGPQMPYLYPSAEYSPSGFNYLG